MLAKEEGDRHRRVTADEKLPQHHQKGGTGGVTVLGPEG
jgi:hypothetical protein